MLTFIHLTALTLAASVSTMLTEHTPVNHSLGGSPAQMTPTYTIMYHDDVKVADSDVTDMKSDAKAVVTDVKSDAKSDATDVKADAKASTDSTKDITADDIAKDVTADATADPVDKSKAAAKVATDGIVGATDGTDGTDTKKDGSDDVNVLGDGSGGGDEEAKPTDDASSS